MLRTDLNPADLTIQRASLETPRILSIDFSDGSTSTFSVGHLPTATASSAETVEIVADGDAVELQTDSGDFMVLAHELAALRADEPLFSPEIAEHIGRRIRIKRQEAGLLLRDVEALTGIAVPNLSALEAGKSLPRLDTLLRVGEALHTPIAELVSESTASDWAFRDEDPRSEAVNAQLRLRRWSQNAGTADPATRQFASLVEHDERANPGREGRNSLYVAISQAHHAFDSVTMFWTMVNLVWSRPDVQADAELRQHVEDLARRAHRVAQLLSSTGTDYPAPRR